MDNTTSPSQGSRKINPADKLKSRLFEKGIGHSSMSSFKSPLSTDYANRMLLVNLNSSNSSKFSPKILRKQIAGLPNQSTLIVQKKTEKGPKEAERIKTTSYDKFWSKESQFLQELSSQTKKNLKNKTSTNFYNTVKHSTDQIQEYNLSATEPVVSPELKKTKQLIDRLSGKSRIVQRQQSKPILPPLSRQERPESSKEEPPVKDLSKSKYEQAQTITLEKYIARALKNEEGLEQFLYLVNNRNNENEPQKEEDPYELFVVEYDTNKEIEQKLNEKYYTVSKKGLCYYVNSKPVEFIELEEWVVEKQNYQKIKNLNFFNRFRKWKTVKMWRKIVLRHSIEESSKNLEEKLFFLNQTMRQCLFQIQELSLDLGQNFIILASNQDSYSLQNFKAIQQNNKRRISAIIQQCSMKSRASVAKCFHTNTQNLKSTIRHEGNDERNEKDKNKMTSHINLKEAAFQALGFPAKMSYEDRSKVRKMAGKFIRFTYLVDMIHTAGLALHFKNQLSLFISKLEESQSPSNLEILMTSQDSKTNAMNVTENSKLFHVKLRLNEKELPEDLIVLVPFQPFEQESLEPFNPLYHLRLYGEDQKNTLQRNYCPTICDQWLTMTPCFADIEKEIIVKIKESLECLKLFERWSKHRDIEVYINIMEEWDDVVSDSRQIVENQNLDPVSIISNLDSSLSLIKNIISKSLDTINTKIRQQFTQFLNIHWQQEKLDLSIFRNPRLQSPPQVIQLFLKYITNSITNIEKKIPYRVRLGAFEINLAEIRVVLMSKAEQTFKNFKEIIPEVVEERTKQVNQWLNTYIRKLIPPKEIKDKQVQNIDHFVNKVKTIKQVQQTFERKKQLCLDLTGIEQIMETYKFGVKKKREPENDTLKLKQVLDNEINSTFEENFKKKAEKYSREVYKVLLPSIVKDISKLNTMVKNQKFLVLKNSQQQRAKLKNQIEKLQRNYQQLAQRNSKCLQYQQILNQFHGVDHDALKNAKAAMENNEESQKSNEIPSHMQQLFSVKEEIECLQKMWEKYDKWSTLMTTYSEKTIINVAADQEYLQSMLTEEREFINKLRKTIGASQTMEQLSKKVQTFQKYLPIIIGLTKNLSSNHWQQINELIRKNSCSISLDAQKLPTLTLADMIDSCVGEFKDQFEQVFVRASNEIKLQQQYNEMQKKWKNATIKIRTDAKYNSIYDENQHAAIMELINQAMDTLTSIFANPYSTRLQVGVLTFQTVLAVLDVYKKWINVQKKLQVYDKICKSIDMKKLAEANLLQNIEKQYKAVIKILLPKTNDPYFNIIKLSPTTNATIAQKLQQCQRMITSLENNIKVMLNEYRKNYQLYYQLDDSELLKLIMETTPQQNSPINLGGLFDDYVCGKFMEGVVKEIKIQGEIMTGIISIDGENMLKAPFTTSTDFNVNINSVIETVSQYCRSMIKACRSKSQENSLFDLVDEFNIQFLLAINKVDFCNYTSISIENNQENPDSLKQYLKIMAKDTRNGIKKLREKTTGNVIGYESLILQNLVHEKILKELVQSKISCANEYNWIKFLRFYWQDTDEANISIKKMHVNLRYGKEYIGSNSKVLIENNSPMTGEYDSLDVVMSVMRNSESYCYIGNCQRLTSFINCTAHRLQKIKCTKQMASSFGNPIKSILKSRQDMDCCYYVQDAHLLSNEAIAQLLSLFQEVYKTKNRTLNQPNNYKIVNYEHNSSFYNPIFLHFPKNQNTHLRICREEYRSVSLTAPSCDLLVCYLQLMYEIVSNNLICHVEQLNGTQNKHHKGIKSGKLDHLETEQLLVSHGQTITFLRKIFEVLSELEPLDNNRTLYIEVFLQYCKERICSIIRKQPLPKNAINTNIDKILHDEHQIYFDLHQILTQILIQYIRPQIRKQNFQIIFEYVKSVYPQITYEVVNEFQESQRPKIEVEIVVGFQDCLQSYHRRKFGDGQTGNQINLEEFSQEELYGLENQVGLLHKMVYSQSEDHETDRVLTIKGLDQKLVTYLTALVDQNKDYQVAVPRSASQKSSSSQAIDAHDASDGKSTTISQKNQNILNDLLPFVFNFERNCQSNLILASILQKFSSKNVAKAITETKREVLKNPLRIQIHVDEISRIIDPKLISQFRVCAVMESFGGCWRYVQERIKQWAEHAYPQEVDQQKRKILTKMILKFYSHSIKGLWKDINKIFQQPGQSSQGPQTTLTSPMINLIRDFLNFLQTLLPLIFSSAGPVTVQANRQQFQKTVIHACMYSLCHVYRNVIDMDLEYIKMENLLEKLQAESWVGIGEMERIKPQEYKPIEDKKEEIGRSYKKRYTFFDYIFDGTKLIPLDEHCYVLKPERTIDRGQFYLTNQFVHLKMMTQRALNTKKFSMLLLGSANSGKSSFCKVYKTQHYSQTAHITINSFKKNKKDLLSKLGKVLSLNNITTIGPKINYSSSLIMVEDLSLPSSDPYSLEGQQCKKMINSLLSIIKKRVIVTACKKYRLVNANFIITHRSNARHDEETGLEDSVIKYRLADPYSSEQSCNIRKIFTQVLKANVLDPQIQQSVLVNLTNVAFDVYESIQSHISTQLAPGQLNLKNVLSLQIIKRMCLFAAHLRFKQVTPSTNEITRFWAYLLKDNFEPYCAHYNLQIRSLKCLQKYSSKKQSTKTISEYLKLPPQQMLYSHLYIKQQIYGNGKEVEYYPQIRKLYNSINQTIHDYNATDNKHRYGYYFGLIVIDELIVKIVKMSNMLINGDYAIFSRKGSEIGALIRLVSFMLGYHYRERGGMADGRRDLSIVDVVRETITELTKVSLYLIAVKVDDTNIGEFLEYYDQDFEAEIAGSMHPGDLHSIQATGAFDFGLGSSGIQNSYQTTKSQSKTHTKQASSSTGMKPTSTHSHSNSKDQLSQSKSKGFPTQEPVRISKSSLREANKMKRSIRLVYEFQDLKYLKYPIQHCHHIPAYIISQLNIDFFHEYPRESVIRLSEQSLGIGVDGEKPNAMVEDANIVENTKDKFGILFEIYETVRQELGLALNEFEECHRLYWYLVGNLSNDIKENITKYELIFDMNTKMQEIVTEISGKMEAKWEEKKKLAAKINEIKEGQYEIGDSDQKQKSIENLQEIENKLTSINTSLQQLTQKRSLCEKVISFFKPTLPQFTRRHALLKNLMNNNSLKLKIYCLIIASYFTYLSKLPFANRKSYLQKWYQQCPSLSKIEQNQRLNSITQFFCLVTEEYMIISDANEHYYENMMIILNSSRAVLIRDNKNYGRNWIASFDDSFASVSESSPDYLEKLEEHLAAGRNIFLEVTNQETLNNSQSNQIHNLIFMEENASSVKIGDTEYAVSNKTKVFIVVAPHIKIPEEILNENLYIIYEESEEDLLKPIETELMQKNCGDKFTQYLEYKKREQYIMSECFNLEIPLANVVFDQIYADFENEDNPKKEQEDELKKFNIDEVKSKEELMERIEFLAKVGALDKHQQRFDRYFAKKKQLEQIRQKIVNINLVSNYNNPKKDPTDNPLQQVLNILKNTYNLISRLKPFNPTLPSLPLYYSCIKEAIRQGLVIINLNEFEHCGVKNNRYNLGMFVLFVLRQWGQRLSRNLYHVMSLCLVVIVDVQTAGAKELNQYIKEVQTFMTIISRKTGPINNQYQIEMCEALQSSQFLTKLCSQNSYSFQTLQQAIGNQILQSIQDQQHFQQLVSQNSGLIPGQKPHKVDENIINILNIGNQEGDNLYDDHWFLGHLVIFNGEFNDHPHCFQQLVEDQEEIDSGLADTDMYANWLVRKMVAKIVDTDGLMEIKNSQNIENQIKKAVHDKLNLLLPVIKCPLSKPKAVLKSESILQQTLTQLVTKYTSSKTHRSTDTNNPNSRMDSIVNSFVHSVKDNGGSGAHLAANRLSEGFRMYVYHYDVQRVTKIIAKVLNVPEGVLMERMLVKDISNSMTFNVQISKILKAKIQSKEKTEEDSNGGHKNITNIGQPSHTRNHGAPKTKKTIINAGQQKESKWRQEKNHPTPSMRNIQNQISPPNPPESAIISPVIVTNKQIPYQPQLNPNPNSTSSNHHQNSTVVALPMTKHVHRVTNLLVSYVQKILLVKTGKVDFGGNFYNHWFISEKYFYGIQRLTQSISMDNQTWNFGKTVIVLCKVFTNLVVNSLNFCLRDHIKKLMSRIIGKLEDTTKAQVSLSASSHRLKNLSSKMIEDKGNESEMQKVVQIVQKAIQEDIVITQGASMINEQMITQFRQEAELIYFQFVFLKSIREFLGLKPIQINIETNFDEKADSLTRKSPSLQKEGQSKRASFRKSKINASQLNQTKPKVGLAHTKRDSACLKNIIDSVIQQDEQTKRLNGINRLSLEQQPKKIQIRSNLIRHTVDELKKTLAHHSIWIQKCKRNQFISQIVFNLILMSKGKIIPGNFKSYLRDCLLNDEDLTMKQTLLKMKALKIDIEKQNKKLNKDPNHIIDLSFCKNPLNFIKTYMHCQFEQKVNKYNLGVGEEQKEPHPSNQQKREEVSYYCLSFSAPTEEMKKEQYLCLKGIWAVGWRLSTESTFETTQEGKITQLNNIYISKRVKPHQMGVCDIQLFQSEDKKGEAIKLYTFTKKNQGLKIVLRSAYTKCPKPE